MRIYTRRGYVLGARCDRGHSGNRHYVLVWPRQQGQSDALLECVGCRQWIPADMAGAMYPSRDEALAADRGFVATWPEDPAEAVLRRERR